mmetsp:Transcript_32709/g.102093  ORF Transcript_32709/g.102093 Transcript_32709/m.102093 type:complete len:141 (-) Transcript_32709:2-424(-)
MLGARFLLTATAFHSVLPPAVAASILSSRRLLKPNEVTVIDPKSTANSTGSSHEAIDSLQEATLEFVDNPMLGRGMGTLLLVLFVVVAVCICGMLLLVDRNVGDTPGRSESLWAFYSQEALEEERMKGDARIFQRADSFF